MELQNNETVTVSCESSGAVSAVTGDPDVATVEVGLNNDVTITGIGGGETDVTISVAADKNYLAPPDKVCHIVVTELPYEKLHLPLNEASINEGTFQQMIKDDLASSVWSLGDQCGLAFSGTVGISTYNTTIHAKLISLNHNMDIQTGGKPNAFFKFPYNANGRQLAFTDSKDSIAIAKGEQGFCMNPSNYKTQVSAAISNFGGWNGCYASDVLMPKFEACFVTSVRNAIGVIVNYTDNGPGGEGNSSSNVSLTKDKIFLLATKEVFGTIPDIVNSYEGNYQVQMQAYANGMSVMHYRFDRELETTRVVLRSPCATTTGNFSNIGANFSTNGGWCNANFGTSMAPVFAIF